MTTTVTINAHLATTKEVQVEINDNSTGTLVEKFTLQDGESAERHVYDGREIIVREVAKEES